MVQFLYCPFAHLTPGTCRNEKVILPFILHLLIAWNMVLSTLKIDIQPYPDNFTGINGYQDTVKMETCYVAQARFKLLDSRDPPTSASRVAETTGLIKNGHDVHLVKPIAISP
ncbi:uncharacterized protein LOC144582933 [Callithrix jacchus]